MSAWINSAWRSCASLLIEDRLTAYLCSACNPHVLPSVSSTSAIQPCHLCHACRASIPLHCPFMMMACVLHPLFPQVYAALSILIPGALRTSCHDCSLLFEFIFPLSCQELLLPCYLLLRPMSTSSFLLILRFLPSYHLRGFVWLLLTRPLCFSSSCLSLGEKTLQVACQALVGRWAKWEGDIAEMEHTNVAAFATCIAWALYTFCYSSSHPNWFFPLTPRTRPL